MAVGDRKVGLQSIISGGFLVIQPPAGEEWVIHNILVENGSTAELYVTDGTNSVLIDSGNTSWIGYVFHLTNTHYLKVKNTASVDKLLGYQGVQTK